MKPCKPSLAFNRVFSVGRGNKVVQLPCSLCLLRLGLISLHIPVSRDYEKCSKS